VFKVVPPVTVEVEVEVEEVLVVPGRAWGSCRIRGGNPLASEKGCLVLNRDDLHCERGEIHGESGESGREREEERKTSSKGGSGLLWWWQQQE